MRYVSDEFTLHPLLWKELDDGTGIYYDLYIEDAVEIDPRFIMCNSGNVQIQYDSFKDHVLRLVAPGYGLSDVAYTFKVYVVYGIMEG